MNKIRVICTCFLLLCLFTGGVTQAVSIIKVSKIQAAGTVIFHANKSAPSDIISWKAARYLVDETTGVYTFPTDTATATGDSAHFSLQKTTGQYTFYKIFAFEGNQLDSLTVQVLTSGIVQKYLYTNLSLSAYSIPVWVVLPPGFSAASKFIMTMCGINRDAVGIATYWVSFANANNYVVAAPEFNSNDWSSDQYILGNMFTGSNGTGSLNPKANWSFNIVEQIHRELFTACSLSDSTYELWGHSAGGQFVHRLAFFLPDNLISRYIAGNSGWYSCPDLAVAFPWGAQNSLLNLAQSDLTAFSNRNLVIMRGTADTLQDSDLNTDPQSEVQGANRYTRAGYFYTSGVKVNQGLNWKIVDVPGVGHSDQLMAVAAGNFILTQMVSANWPLNTDGTPVIKGNITASIVDPSSSTNITGFTGYSFSSSAPAGLTLGATGPTNWPADGSTTTANASFTGLSTGTLRYVQFTYSPSIGNKLNVTSITIPLTENGSATNINVAMGYSTDGINFTTINSNGLSGNALPSNTMQAFIATPSLNISSGTTFFVRLILWRKANSTASSSSVTIGNIILAGTTAAGLSPIIATSTLGPLAFPLTSIGSSTASQSFSLNGSNLTSNILVSPSSGFEIRTGTNSFSTNTIILTPSNGSVSTTNIDVRFTPLTYGAYSGTVVCASSGATEQDVAVTGTSAVSYYSKSSGNLDVLANWTTDPNGGSGTAPSDFITSAQTFYIRNNPTPTIGANWTVSGSTSRIVVGDGINGCIFTVPSAFTYSSPSTEISSNTTFVLQNSSSFANLGTLTVDSGGVYQHDCDGGSLLTGNFLTGSTINVTGVKASNLWLPVSSYNVIWNCPSQTAAGKFYNTDGTLNLNGNLTIISTGTGYCAVNTGAGARTLNIAGNVNVQGGSFRLLGASSGTGVTTINVAGNVSVNGTGVLNISSTSNVSPGLANINVLGNFLHLAGSVTKTSSAGPASITFNGTLPQLFSTTGMAAAISFVINNPSGVTLGTNVSLGGTIALTSGILTTGSDTLILNNNTTGAVTRTSGWVNGYLKRAFAASTGSYLFPIGDAALYRGATVNFTGAPAKATNLTASFNGTDPGTNGLPSGISNYWHDGYWIVSSDTIPGGTYSISLDVNGISGVTSGDTQILQRETGSDAWTIAGTFSDLTGGVITQTGIISFSQFALGNKTNPLPVDLESFTANTSNRKVNLIWSTATESSFYKFIVERTSGKSTDWRVVGEVKGNGNSSTGHTYNLSDAGAVGTLKYRLHIIDNDGTGTYSQEIFVKAGLPEHFQVYQNYPNPFNPSTIVAYDLPADSYVKIELYSITGSRVTDLSDGNQSAGYHNITISMNRYGLSSGIYFYKVSGYDLSLKKSFLTIKKMIFMK